MIKLLLDRIKHRRFCKLNHYYCPDCIYHDFIFEGSIFRGNRCRWGRKEKMSRIEQELHGKTPEEQYEFLYWLLLKFGLAYTDSRLAVIEWLRGEKEE